MPRDVQPLSHVSALISQDRVVVYERRQNGCIRGAWSTHYESSSADGRCRIGRVGSRSPNCKCLLFLECSRARKSSSTGEDSERRLRGKQGKDCDPPKRRLSVNVTVSSPGRPPTMFGQIYGYSNRKRRREKARSRDQSVELRPREKLSTLGVLFPSLCLSIQNLTRPF